MEQGGDWPFRLRESTLLEEAHRRTTGRRPWPEVLALAFDHRKQLEELGPAEKIRAFKRLIASALSSISSKSNVGAIVDELAVKFDADRKTIEADVIEMLADLMNKRVLER